MRLRRIIACLTLLLLVLSTAETFAQESLELRVAWWGSQNRHDRTLAVIELFEEKYPHITVYPEYIGWDEYWTRLTTQAAGNNLPDVIQHDYAFLSEWADRGLLVPLDSYVESGVLDLANVAESQVAGGRIDGRLYGVNLGTNSQTFIIDEERFTEAGVPLPDPDWTWSDFGEVTRKIQAETGMYGMGVGIDDIQIFKVWLSEHGQSLYNEDATTLGYDDDRLFVDYFNMLLGLAADGAVPTRAFDVARGELGTEDQLVVTDEAAMGYMWSNQIVATSTAAGHSFKMALLPRADAYSSRPGNYLKPSQFFSVTSQSGHPEEAALFIDFFTNSIEANTILMAERGVPISANVREALLPELGAPQREMFAYISLAEANSVPIDPPDPPGHTNVINNVYEPLVDQILYERISPEAGAERFRTQVNRIMAQNR